MASKLKLSGTEMKRLKNDRQACADQQEDCELAMKAGIPGVGEILEIIKHNAERIDKLFEYLGGER